MDEADIIAALVAIVKSDAAVAAIAADNIFGIELPKAAVAAMPINALVIQPSGGVPLTAGSDAAIDTQRIDIISYGPTPLAANALRLKARKALVKTRRRTVEIVPGGPKVLVHWVNIAGGFFAARERDGLWPQSFQSFQVLYSTQEI